MLRIKLQHLFLLLFLCILVSACKQEKTAISQSGTESIEALNLQISSLEENLDKLKAKRKAVMRAQGIEYIEEEEVLTSTASDSTVIIKGIAKSLLNKKLKISLDRPYRNDFASTLRIGANGKFEKEIRIKEPAIYSLKFGDLKTQIYLEPGKMLGLLIDTSAQQDVSFMGDLSLENNHMYSTAAFDKKIECPELNNQNEIEECLNTILASSQNFVDENSSDDFSEPYAQLIQNNYLFSSLLQFVRKIDSQDIDATIEQHIDLSKIKIQKPGTSNVSLFSLYAYRKFIFEFFELSCKTIKKDSSIREYDKYASKYQKVASLFQDSLDQNFIKTDIVFEAISQVKSSELNPLVLKLRDEVYNKHYLNTINDHYKKNILTGVGTLAPPITGPSYAGDRIHLKDYEGKYVYIFVWATWCGPCKMEIPFYQKLIDEYSGSNVEFLGVAVDKDESKWLESFLFQKYPGTQMLVKGDWNSPMIKDFNLKSVPQFILINPQGEIVTLNAPRPSKGASAYLDSFGA